MYILVTTKDDGLVKAVHDFVVDGHEDYSFPIARGSKLRRSIFAWTLDNFLEPHPISSHRKGNSGN